MPAEYDLCRLAEDPHNDPKDLFPPSRKVHGRSFQFWNPAVRFRLGKELGKGAYGTIYHGTFGTQPVAIKVNNPKQVLLKTDADEVRMQFRLHCHMNAAAQRQRTMAAIPKTYFAARVPASGRALGMERMDRNLLAHVQRQPTAQRQIDVLHDALLRLARLLQVLQHDLRFMHGDLHGENVMVRDEPYEVYLIDFGMASMDAVPGARRRRDVTDARYEDVPFHPHLDLLTLLTSLREDLALSKHTQAAQWCDDFIRPFWDVVLNGLYSGTVRKRMRYRAQHTVQSARDEIRESGEIYYAHHLLYDAIGAVTYRPCSPSGLQKALGRSPRRVRTNEKNWHVRIFEDMDGA